MNNFFVNVFDKNYKNYQSRLVDAFDMGFNFKCILLLPDIKILKHSQNMLIDFFSLLGNGTERLRRGNVYLPYLGLFCREVSG